ncbi:MAG: cobyrinic acid a,c-diamide synthase [Firmicutes bacterium HGW-Firmicutes-13]|nr:MAG: cobyrinic acid a,c-diamide synthase [Firmicutes bacterium HGW-Firmicutes-13]
MSRFIIAGTHSGVGKTTITAAIISALRKRNFKVQPFKVGPDYIDPGYHTLASGRRTRNLDGWMLNEDQVKEILARNTPEKGVSVIEGVMGLFDGYAADRDEGSTAHMAKITETPVILIIDGSKMARSAAAVALGFKLMDPEVNICGLIFNKLGGDSHYRLVKKAVEHLNIPVLGYFPREEVLLPERHLGLVPTSEMNQLENFIEYWRERVEKYLDIKKIIEIAGRVNIIKSPDKPTLPQEYEEPSCNLAVVRDRAFTFYYPENLELLESWGANIIEVSLIEDRELPEDCHGLYIGGGFPEIFAGELSENIAMLQSIRKAAQEGMPVYGECGGFMYLTQGVEDFEGNFYPLAGIFSCKAVMNSCRQALGYILAETRMDNFLTLKGEKTRGHEFHWSEITREGLDDFVYCFPNKGHKLDGFLYRNVLGSYAHLHFYSNPVIAERFVECCRNYRSNKE